MTRQIPETVLYKGKRCALDDRIMYIPKNHTRIVPCPPGEATLCTGCYRGFVGTWEIKRRRLYLLDLSENWRLKGRVPLFAEWFTGKPTATFGNRLPSCGSPYSPRYEQAVQFTIKKGVVTKIREWRYRFNEKDLKVVPSPPSVSLSEIKWFCKFSPKSRPKRVRKRRPQVTS